MVNQNLKRNQVNKWDRSVPRPKKEHSGSNESKGKKNAHPLCKTDVVPTPKTEAVGDQSKEGEKRQPAEYFKYLLHPKAFVTLFCCFTTAMVGVKGTLAFLSIYGGTWVLLFASTRTIARAPSREEPFFVQWAQSRIALALVAAAFAVSGSEQGDIAPYFLIVFSACACAMTDQLNFFKKPVTQEEK